MSKQRTWVVFDEGPFPGNEKRAWGPFPTKKQAQAWAKDNLCECCKHPAMPLYATTYEGDWA